MTLPKELRERFGIRGSDEVVVREEDGRIVVEKPVSRDELAEGYRRRAEKHRRIADETEGTSGEANQYLGDAPEW